MLTLEIYATADGKEPFSEWLFQVKDKEAVKRILNRLRRIEGGNFGDNKPVKNVSGLYELREHHGPGYRIFYAKRGNTVVIILAGSSKRDQRREIERAARYLADLKTEGD